MPEQSVERAGSASREVAASPAGDELTEEKIRLLGDAASAFIGPLAKSKETAEREATKRAEIDARLSRQLIWTGAVIVTAIIVLGAIALFLGKDAYSQSVLIAVVSFLGGIGVGRSSRR